MGRGWVVGWVLSSFGLSRACGGAEASLAGRAAKSCTSTFLPGLACLSCWSSAGDMKPRLRLSHCGLEEVMSGEDIKLAGVASTAKIVAGQPRQWRRSHHHTHIRPRLFAIAQ